MSLKSKIEAVIYASEEPVTLVQLVVLLSEEVQLELDALAARQEDLPLEAPLGTEGDERFGNVPAAIDAHPVVPADAEESGATDPAESETVSDETPRADTDVQGDADENLAPEAATPHSASTEADKRKIRERERAVREYLREIVNGLMREYAEADRGLEIREVAGGFRFGTKPEYHDAVRGFVRSLKPALKLTLQALETLAVVAYKQPVTAAEISEIRGVDSAGVLGGLLTRKLIQTAGRKQVVGRPMLYKTSKEFLVRFGLRDIQELPSMEEFERMAGELTEQEDLPMESTDNIVERANARGDAEHIREHNGGGAVASSPAEEAGERPDALQTTEHPADAGQGDQVEQATAGDSSAQAETRPDAQEPA